MGWKTTGGGGGLSSPLTTKGDLWGYDTDDQRVPIGSDGEVLTADSGEALGLKWAAPSGGGGGPTVVYKTASESVTSSDVMQNDNHLTFAVGANEAWVIQCYLRMDGATGGDFRAGFSAPSGATGWCAVLGTGIGSSVFSDTLMDNQAASLAIGGFAGGIGAGNQTLVFVTGYVAISSTSGNVTLQWAQRVSNGTATRLDVGSFLVAHQVV